MRQMMFLLVGSNLLTCSANSSKEKMIWSEEIFSSPSALLHGVPPSVTCEEVSATPLIGGESLRWTDSSVSTLACKVLELVMNLCKLNAPVFSKVLSTSVQLLWLLFRLRTSHNVIDHNTFVARSPCVSECHSRWQWRSTKRDLKIHHSDKTVGDYLGILGWIIHPQKITILGRHISWEMLSQCQQRRQLYVLWNSSKCQEFLIKLHEVKLHVDNKMWPDLRKGPLCAKR